jgi:hypothetical protein
MAAETLSLPGGTVLTAADHEALVTRFTAHARVLIGNGLCPLHETPLLKAGQIAPSCAGGCARCARNWWRGPVKPYVIDGSWVTGGEPLHSG